MTDIANLLREAAEEIEMSRGYCDFADELRSAAESLGEPVAWMSEHDKHPAQFELHDPFEHTPEAIQRAMQSRRLLGWRLTPLYLAPQAAVPVAYEHVAECQYSGPFPCNPTCHDSGWCYKKRITSSTQSPQPAVPDGWKLVPVEPTDEMIDAGRDSAISEGFKHIKNNYRRIYSAMLNAVGDSHDA